MLKFKEYLKLSESTKDVYSAIGKTQGDKLLKTNVDPKVQGLHDKTFGHGKHHIEIPLSNPVPDKVIEHVKSQGDTMEGDKVKLKSGRHVELSKYLPKSKASKSVMDDHENWSRNKGASNTKLVISRHPGEVASCSTGTHWDSCANLESDGPAAQGMHHEIKHGTLIAMHVHAGAKPDEHGEYNSKDVLGRALIKRHDSPEKNISYHKEENNYGAFPHVASEAIHHFTNKHYPQKDTAARKHEDLYDDDSTPIKINKSAGHAELHKIINGKGKNHIAIAIAALNHPNATPDHIDKALSSKDDLVRWNAIRHPKATPDNIDKALNDSDFDVRSAAVRHPNATAHNLDNALSSVDDEVRIRALIHPKLTAAHITKALKDPNLNVRNSAAAAAARNKR